MRNLSTLVLTASLALGGCSEIAEAPKGVTDGISNSRARLNDVVLPECTVERTNMGWTLIQGECDETGLVQGPGQAKNDYGDMYKGTFRDGRFNGYGVYTLSDKSQYEGIWTNGVYARPDAQGRNAEFMGGTSGGLTITL